MIGRLLKPADFQRVFSGRPCCSTVHFALHYLASPPIGRAQPLAPKGEVLPAETGHPEAFPDLSPELSTGGGVNAPQAVDECRHWLGLVVPKRHAKRAVTRNLFKRQIRAEMHRRHGALPPGVWVVRLRAPFDRKTFVSAQSPLLRAASGNELAQLFERAAPRPVALA